MQKPIAFYPQLSVELGDIASAIYYQQLYYWKDKGDREDGFVYKTQKEIQEETTLTRKQQDRIRKKLVEKEWLEVEKIKAPNGSPTLHYRCLVMFNFVVEKGKFRKCAKGTNGNVPKGQMEMYQRDKSSITENTTESCADAQDFSYLPVSEQTYKNKNAIAARKGIRLKKPKRTAAAELSVDRLQLVEYFKRKYTELIGEHNYFTHPQDIVDVEKENSKISGNLKVFYSRCDNDMDKAKKVIDFFLSEKPKKNEDIPWHQYKPQICFTKNTITNYENAKPKRDRGVKMPDGRILYS